LKIPLSNPHPVHPVNPVRKKSDRITGLNLTFDSKGVFEGMLKPIFLDITGFYKSGVQKVWCGKYSQ